MIINKYVVKEESQIPFYVTKQKSVNAKISETGIPILVQFGEKKPQMVGIDVVDLQKQAEALGRPLKPLPGNMSSKELTHIFRIRRDLFFLQLEELRQIDQKRWVLPLWGIGKGATKAIELGSLIDPQEWDPQQTLHAIFKPHEGYERDLLEEIEYLKKCSESPYILNPPKIYIWNGLSTYLGELYDCDALEAFWKTSRYKCNDQMRLSAVFQVAKGLAYIHERLIMHGDVTPKNILLRMLDGGAVKAALCDFGLSEQLKHPKEKKEWLTNLHWLAPEGYNSLASDLWSFGITVRMIYTGYMPLPRGTDKQFKKAMRSIGQKQFDGLPPNKPIFEEGANTYRKTLQSVMRRTLLIDPEMRANAAQVVTLFAKV